MYVSITSVNATSVGIFFFFFWWGRDNKILIINSFSKVLGRLWHRLLIQREFIERLKLLITYKQQKCFQAEHI